MHSPHYGLNWKIELLAVVFGILVALIIFGDSLPVPGVGNLDTVFGLKLWPYMDVVYPLSSIIVFLAYGKLKGGLRLHAGSILLFIAFLAALALMQFDDAFVVFRHPIELPDIYWTTVRWLYLFVAPGTFLAFGIECEKNKTAARP